MILLFPLVVFLEVHKKINLKLTLKELKKGRWNNVREVSSVIQYFRWVLYKPIPRYQRRTSHQRYHQLVSCAKMTCHHLPTHLKINKKMKQLWSNIMAAFVVSHNTVMNGKMLLEKMKSRKGHQVICLEIRSKLIKGNPLWMMHQKS